MAVDFDVAPSEMEIFLLDDRKTLAAVSPVWENGYMIFGTHLFLCNVSGLFQVDSVHAET
ncbi:MAG: hypothetical protein V8T87_06180 [Victivallales bacterium]